MSAVATAAATSGVDFVERISSEEFNRDYIRQNRPLVMRQQTRDWPAMSKWSFEFFAGKSTDKKVYLEQNNVMQGEARYLEMTYSEYIRRLIGSSTNVGSSTGYLSVFKIFRTFPELSDDVDFSIFSQHKVRNTVAGWIGPAGTVTGYHIDWGDNMLAQVYGRKEVRLVAPSDSRFMYPSNRFDQGTTSSSVDVDDFDAVKFPLFEQARQHNIVLEPGHMLFIPRGWWHYVRSIDKSISVSNIGYDAKGLVVDLLSHRLKQILHDMGIYRVPCTCHYVHEGKRVRRNVAN